METKNEIIHRLKNLVITQSTQITKSFQKQNKIYISVDSSTSSAAEKNTSFLHQSNLFSTIIFPPQKTHVHIQFCSKQQWRSIGGVGSESRRRMPTPCSRVSCVVNHLTITNEKSFSYWIIYQVLYSFVMTAQEIHM